MKCPSLESIIMHVHNNYSAIIIIVNTLFHLFSSTALIGFIATGLFTDFYLWDLNPDTLVLDLYNLERAEQPRTDALNYLKIPNMHYSSWLQIGGIST